MRRTINKKLYLLTTGIVIVATVLMPMIFESKSSTTSLESSYVKIEHCHVIDALNDHNYAVFIGARWKRINGCYGENFFSKDYDYENLLSTSTSFKTDEWYQMGSEYDLDHVVNSIESEDASTQRGWQKLKTESGYELVIWVQLCWKYTFIGTDYHRGYDYYVISSWTSGAVFTHDFYFEGAIGDDLNSAVRYTLRIYS